jgi:sulfide:quinone oxidoreductase
MHDERHGLGPTSRRRLLQGATALGLAGGAIHGRAEAQEPVPTTARIVVAGAGAAGLATASRLSRRLDGAKITLIDARKEHWYQPGFTLVAAGLKPERYVLSNTADHVPREVDLIEASVAAPEPDGKVVESGSGRRRPYDYLVVATVSCSTTARSRAWMPPASARTASAATTPAPRPR